MSTEVTQTGFSSVQLQPHNASRCVPSMVAFIDGTVSALVQFLSVTCGILST